MGNMFVSLEECLEGYEARMAREENNFEEDNFTRQSFEAIPKEGSGDVFDSFYKDYHRMLKDGFATITSIDLERKHRLRYSSTKVQAHSGPNSARAVILSCAFFRAGYAIVYSQHSFSAALAIAGDCVAAVILPRITTAL